MNIFRVIQEAINNAIKYADAKKIEVQISKDNQNFIISIIDNGKGFDLNKIELGNGLSNMEKRMSEIDGKINISSKPNSGTEIKLEVSFKNTSNDV
ncbi:MAG: ATP-binding protein, partial [Polaribacter sp.]|uniref:sensor histidine kinase n=1 Tax=Polaribacter sp. TaxID=1920175 RepID=UPI003BB0A68E